MFTNLLYDSYKHTYKNKDIELSVKYIVKYSLWILLLFAIHKNAKSKLHEFFKEYVNTAAIKYDSRDMYCYISDIIKKYIEEPFSRDCKDLHIKYYKIELMELVF